MTLTVNERFWAKVQRQGGATCWEWQGYVMKDGYGRFRIGGRSGRMVLAHRVAYELVHGKIPSGEGHHGTCVLHRCDNRRCVNPDHLFLGTQRVNVRDMMNKGRARFGRPVGERVGASKLTVDSVREIRRLHREGLSLGKIAIRMGVTKSPVHDVIRGASWRHV